jgi:hypothetical protein
MGHEATEHFAAHVHGIDKASAEHVAQGNNTLFRACTWVDEAFSCAYEATRTSLRMRMRFV